jgi:DNA-binding winged helix-turn-helix (wHTH) protein
VTFEFEQFQFTPASGELMRSGVRLRLNEQTAQVLNLLLENHGKLVTRESIRQLLWPNGPVVEHQKAINNCISRLREAFQDDPLNPKFIERLPKRGYRFIAIARRVTPEDDETSSGSLLSLYLPGDVQGPDPALAVPPVGGLPVASNPPATAATGRLVFLRIRKVRPWMEMFIFGKLIVLIIAFLVCIRGILVVKTEGSGSVLLGLAPFSARGPGASALAQVVRGGLMDSLSKSPGIRIESPDTSEVLKPASNLQRERQKYGLDGVIFGLLTNEGGQCHIELELVRTMDSAHIATMEYPCAAEPPSDLKQRVTRDISSKLKLLGN